MQSFSERIPFSSWHPTHVPPVAAGVYAIWDRDLLIYCGMSGRRFDPVAIAAKSKHGLVTRLNSHASGRLSGDQFCVYVANRLVIPTLVSTELAKFATGELSLDQLTKHYIRQRLSFQFVTTKSAEEAYALEAQCRKGIVFGQSPMLNPLTSRDEA